MAENQDWQWDEEEKKAKADEGESPAEEFNPAGPVDEPAAAAEKSSVTRILFLVLLLVLVGAAGFYYFAGVPEPGEQDSTAGVQKQPIVMPMPIPPKEEAAAPVEAPAATAPLPKGVLKEVIVEQKVAVAGEPVPVVVSVGAAAEQTASASMPEPAAAAAQASGQTVAPAPAAQKPATEPPAAASVPPASEVAKTAPAEAAAAKGNFWLQSGVFTDRNDLEAAQKTLRRLGYQVRVLPVKSTLEMTRLSIGSFSPEEAKTRLQKLLKGPAPDAFALPGDGRVKVYAASYYDLDKARAFADQLFQKGIRVEEEAATVEVSLSKLSFGDFADRAAADKAAEKARAEGLEVQVVNKP